MGCGKPCLYSCNRIVSTASKGPLPAGAHTHSWGRILECGWDAGRFVCLSSCQYLVNLANLQRQLSTRADSLATLFFSAALCNHTNQSRDQQQDDALCRRRGPLITPVSSFQNCRASHHGAIRSCVRYLTRARHVPPPVSVSDTGTAVVGDWR
jgi:hypothetical protein